MCGVACHPHFLPIAIIAYPDVVSVTIVTCVLVSLPPHGVCGAVLPIYYIQIIQYTKYWFSESIAFICSSCEEGATLMRRETDSVSAAPDRVCGPLWMKLVQSPCGVLVLKGGNPWSLQCLVHCTHISVVPCVQPFFPFSLF